jgi:hypothetical protein
MPEIMGPPAVGASDLDSPPPQPPMQAPKGNLMESGMGPNGGTPQAIALQGLAMVEQGVRLLGTALPGAAAAAADMLGTLRMGVAQAVSQMGVGAGPPPVAGGGPPMPQGLPPQGVQ